MVWRKTQTQYVQETEVKMQSLLNIRSWYKITVGQALHRSLQDFKLDVIESDKKNGKKHASYCLRWIQRNKVGTLTREDENSGFCFS